MLTKHFLPRAYMNREHVGIAEDIIQIPLQVGYMLSWDLWHKSSVISSLDTGKIYFHNYFFYRKNKMTIGDRIKADEITLAVYNALLKSNLYDITSRDKQLYSLTYDRYVEYADLPCVLVRVYADENLKDRQEIRIQFDANQVKAIESDSYLTVLNQALAGIDENLTILAPAVKNGWYVYQIKDSSVNYRINLDDFEDDLNDYSIYLDHGHVWNLSKQFGALITGASGTGKTSLLYSLIYQLMQKKNVEIYIADGKNDELGAVMSQILPHDHVVVGADTPKLVHKLVKSTDGRYKNMSKERKKNPQLAFANFDKFNYKLTVLFIDEQSAVTASLSDSKAKKQYQADLLRLVQTSRAAGIIPVISMQQANANSIGGVLGTAIREQISGLKVVMGTPSTISLQDKQMVFGTGVELPPTRYAGTGSGYLQIAGMTSPEPFQAPLLPCRSEDLYKLLKHN